MRWCIYFDTKMNKPYRFLLFIFYFLLFSFAAAIVPEEKTKKSDEQIHLLHSDVLYKSWQDPSADVLVGHVRLYHDGVYLNCDSARFYKQENSFDAFGHVKMVQGDTVTLTSDTLFYDGYDMKARARGHCILIDKKTKLVTENLDYDRIYNVGMYLYGGTLYDGDNVLVSDWGQLTTTTHEAFFTDNVVLTNPKFKLVTDTLYYYTNTEVARIVTPSNIISDDGTFIYGIRGDYNTKTGEAFLLDRSYIIKDMRKVVGDSLHTNEETGFSEAFWNAVITDEENDCMLTGNYCSYDDKTGTAIATDSAVVYEYSQPPDTLYLHGDTLKMFTFNMNTDSVYRDLHAYHKVRFYRRDVQGVCDSMVTHELDSCTYMYGQPIIWNEQQQVFGEEIRIYNNDSTIDWMHIINQAMTIEKLDSASYNQVASKEMFSYFVAGQIDHNIARGNVFVDYFMDEEDGNRIGMNYSESTELYLYMKNKKVDKIWMPAATGTVYPELMIPAEKRYLQNFAWFDYIRPLDKHDIFKWRGKDEKNILKKTEPRKVPLQKLDNLKLKKDKKPEEVKTDTVSGENVILQQLETLQ